MFVDYYLKTKKELLEKGYVVENNIIEKVDANCIGHFGDSVSFEIFCKNVVPYAARDNTSNIGVVIKAFIELFKLGTDNGTRLSEIRNIPCRIALNKNGRCVAIGHFMEDRFLLIEDLAGFTRYD